MSDVVSLELGLFLRTIQQVQCMGLRFLFHGGSDTRSLSMVIVVLTEWLADHVWRFT
jgi:hypothetical protein